MSAQPQPAGLGEFGEAVRSGLTAAGQKTLPCRYLYDDVGTLLFQTICLLPEYGLTRADDRLIRAHARELAAGLSPRVTVVELGSGAGSKTGHILKALSQRSRPVYYPGTTIAANAAVITLGPNEERSAMDFGLQLVPTAQVKGRVIDAGGRPQPLIAVSLLELQSRRIRE